MSLIEGNKEIGYFLSIKICLGREEPYFLVVLVGRKGHQWRRLLDIIGKTIIRKHVGSHQIVVSPRSNLRLHLVDKEVKGRTFKDALIDKPHSELENHICLLELEVDHLRSLLLGRFVAICLNSLSGEMTEDSYLFCMNSIAYVRQMVRLFTFLFNAGRLQHWIRWSCTMKMQIQLLTWIQLYNNLFLPPVHGLSLTY